MGTFIRITLRSDVPDATALSQAAGALDTLAPRVIALRACGRFGRTLGMTAMSLGAMDGTVREAREPAGNHAPAGGT
jgi:hypothetical protein